MYWTVSPTFKSGFLSNAKWIQELKEKHRVKFRIIVDPSFRWPTLEVCSPTGSLIAELNPNEDPKLQDLRQDDCLTIELPGVFALTTTNKDSTAHLCCEVHPELIVKLD